MHISAVFKTSVMAEMEKAPAESIDDLQLQVGDVDCLLGANKEVLTRWQEECEFVIQLKHNVVLDSTNFQKSEKQG